MLTLNEALANGRLCCPRSVAESIFFFPLDFENFAEIEKLNVTKSSRRAYSLQEMIFTSCCQTALVRKSKELSLISGGISCS